MSIKYGSKISIQQSFGLTVDETALHLRYRALRGLGSSVFVWADCGTYFVPMDIQKPDFARKRSITLSEFDALLTHAELGIRKPHAQSQLADSTIEGTSPMPRVQYA